MSYLSLSKIRATRKAFSWGLGKIRSLNPFAKAEKINTNINELGEQTSIFTPKKRYTKPYQTKNTHTLTDNFKSKNLELTPKQSKLLKKMVSKGEITKEYLEIFIKNYHLEGAKFIQSAFDDIARIMGFKYYPKLEIKNGYRICSTNIYSIQISLSAFKSKGEFYNAIAHEMEHWRHKVIMFKAFGKETYINAEIEMTMTKLKMNKKHCISKFGKPFDQVSSEELNKFKKNLYDYMSVMSKRLEFEARRMGEILPGSGLYKEAEEYLNALKNYKSPSMLFDGNLPKQEELESLLNSDVKFRSLYNKVLAEYICNPMEKSAYKKGYQAEDMYNKFSNALI